MNRTYQFNLAKIRKQAKRWLTDTCQIERQHSGVNPAGQPVAGWYLVDTVPCRVHPVRQRGQGGEVADREANISRYELELLPDADLRDGDRVKYRQLLYEVQEIAFPITDAIFKSAQIVRIST